MSTCFPVWQGHIIVVEGVKLLAIPSSLCSRRRFRPLYITHIHMIPWQRAFL